jgi:hypothetical protein
MAPAMCPIDPSSFANTDQAIVRHSHLEWTVDLTLNIIKGSVRHTVEFITCSDTIVLDSSGLKVDKITSPKGELSVFYY